MGDQDKGRDKRSRRIVVRRGRYDPAPVSYRAVEFPSFTLTVDADDGPEWQARIGQGCDVTLTKPDGSVHERRGVVTAVANGTATIEGMW